MTSLKKMFRRLAMAGALGATLVTGSVKADDSLTIGSDAPALDIEHWVQNGNGKFKPVTEFEKGKVYVVEFWATWCGPCIMSMPHLVEMQQKFADKGVQIVSISNEDLDTVKTFLEREFKPQPGEKSEGDAPKTYGELTSAYCLTTDPDQSSNESYMEAAGQNGIPCAFIVGKDKKIEWIGHPMQMDEVLEQVVDGKWDRKAFAEEFVEKQKINLLMAKVMRQARSGNMDEAIKLIDEAAAEISSPDAMMQLNQIRISLLVQSGKVEEALKALDDLIAKEKSADVKRQMSMMRIQVLMQDLKSPKLAEGVKQAYEQFQDQPTFVNFIAWSLFEQFEAKELDDKSLLQASQAAVEKAAKTAEGNEKAAILDTLAHYQNFGGDRQAALKTQEEALKLADGNMKAQLQQFYEELKKE